MIENITLNKTKKKSKKDINKLNENTDKKLVERNKIIDKILSNFETITLDKMKKVSLLDRAETKFVMNIESFIEALGELSKYYKILEVKDNKENNYETLYYDTKDFEMFRNHHNGRLNRYKIRTREYVDSNLAFMEIKFKNNKDKTVKKRIKAPELITKIDDENAEFVDSVSSFDSIDLQPVLWNKYTRITLVSKTKIERLTIDFNLEFISKDKKSIKVPNLVIAEIKQKKFSQDSDFIRLMHEKKIRQTGFSKYCVGVSMLYDEVKSNNFKEKLLLVNKLNRGIEE